MRKLKQIKISELKTDISLFPSLKNKSNKAHFPLLVDKKNQLLCSKNYVAENLEYIDVYEILDLNAHLDYIIDFQQDLDRQKLSFSAKYQFYQNISQLYSDIDKLNILKALDFPVQKKPVLDFLNILEKEERDAFFEKGISSFREAEYLEQIIKAGFKEIFLKTKLKSKPFKLALNMAFELLKSDKLGSSKDYDPQFLEKQLTEKRYPNFFQYLTEFKDEMKKINSPSFLKITTLPFFEAKKLILSAELKNEQQLSELLQFFSKYQSAIRRLSQFLDEK